MGAYSTAIVTQTALLIWKDTTLHKRVLINSFPMLVEGNITQISVWIRINYFKTENKESVSPASSVDVVIKPTLRIRLASFGLKGQNYISDLGSSISAHTSVTNGSAAIWSWQPQRVPTCVLLIRPAERRQLFVLMKRNLHFLAIFPIVCVL